MFWVVFGLFCIGFTLLFPCLQSSLFFEFSTVWLSIRLAHFWGGCCSFCDWSLVVLLQSILTGTK